MPGHAPTQKPDSESYWAFLFKLIYMKRIIPKIDLETISYQDVDFERGIVVANQKGEMTGFIIRSSDDGSFLIRYLGGHDSLKYSDLPTLINCNPYSTFYQL